MDYENYLKIENIGAAPVEAFTLIGASTKRQNNNPNIIGILFFRKII